MKTLQKLNRARLPCHRLSERLSLEHIFLLLLFSSQAKRPGKHNGAYLVRPFRQSDHYDEGGEDVQSQEEATNEKVGFGSHK